MGAKKSPQAATPEVEDPLATTFGSTMTATMADTSLIPRKRQPRVRHLPPPELTEAEETALETLRAVGMSQLASFAEASDDWDGKRRLLAQVQQLDTNGYPGGLRAYVANAAKLLAEAKDGANPAAGLEPEVPPGVRLDPEVDLDAFLAAEEAGLDAAGSCCFVLVAGGLGERLGFHGIKLGLPAEVTSGEVFLQRYASSILALEGEVLRRTGRAVSLPLAIMTSDDTHDMTLELLEGEGYFGLMPAQVTLMKQEPVPALGDNEASLVQDPEDPFRLLTKPHGHGDVHTLLQRTGLTSRWRAEGFKYVFFFQDTNGLIFHAMPAAVGAAMTQGYAYTTVTVARTPGEAVGAICKLCVPSSADEAQAKALKKLPMAGRTLNVEYNQLDGMLRASGFPGGDAAREGGDGYSPFPGGINALVVDLETLCNVLDETNGQMPEFVNPKYADATKDKFKSPTRLESLMQDLPKLLSKNAKVGHVMFPRWLCFSAVKNNVKDAAAKSVKGLPAESAATGEHDIYEASRRLLAIAGVEVGAPSQSHADFGTESDTFLGVTVKSGPHVVLGQELSLSLSTMKKKFPCPERVSISKASTLLVTGGGEVTIVSLKLDGALHVHVGKGASLVIEDLVVINSGEVFEPLGGEELDRAPEALQIRGYTLKGVENRRILDFTEQGEYRTKGPFGVL